MMATADVLISLMEACMAGDRETIISRMNMLIAQEHQANKRINVDRYRNLLNRYEDGRLNSKSRQIEVLKTFRINMSEGMTESCSRHGMDQLILSDDVRAQCLEFIKEQKSRERLADFNLVPRNRLALIGPPGNGKTTLAASIAFELQIPFFTFSQGTLMSSYMGKTGERIHEIFKAASNVGACVLFIDEFDAFGAERDGNENSTDIGEAKRITSFLLTAIEQLPNYVVLVAATNHPHMIDGAFWRRFQMHITLSPPVPAQVRNLIRSVTVRHNIDFAGFTDIITNSIKWLCYADVEQFCLDVIRTRAMSDNGDLKQIVDCRLKQWNGRYTNATI